MNLKERLTKFATTPSGVIPASPGFMPDDARKVLALLDVARRFPGFPGDPYSQINADWEEEMQVALAAMEA